MPSIPITDGVDVTVDAQIAPWSTLAKYAADLPKLIAGGADLSHWRLLTLSDPAVSSLDLGISLDKPVPLGNDAPELTLGGDAALHFSVIKGDLFAQDLFGDP